ncbi:hypothetical protein BZA77DRAFT_390754 [Pyronema omphalodes]|nr:hypothetical protein BZA77DRAFT_390754 [Pyronema omphalodes]
MSTAPTNENHNHLNNCSTKELSGETDTYSIEDMEDTHRNSGPSTSKESGNASQAPRGGKPKEPTSNIDTASTIPARSTALNAAESRGKTTNRPKALTRAVDPEFSRSPPTTQSTNNRTLYNPKTHKQKTSAKASRDDKQTPLPQARKTAPEQRRQNAMKEMHEEDGNTTATTETYENHDRLQMIKEPETRPISSDQLIVEVKGIYAGLIMVEAKCCEVDAKQHQAVLAMDTNTPPLNHEQWQALIALHRTLLHEHHDFFLASQHPSAGAALKKLAQKYSMPARMWRHGIHSFLELLRHRLPHSLEHMLTFIYLAYSMMALLYETVPAFEETWIECLGDLGRYRMAIEDDDVRDREVWQNCAKFWYSKAADKNPNVGRLYHHLAILARPNIVHQFFYYCKSLGVVQPFNSARESILTVFDPIYNKDLFSQKNVTVTSLFIQLHCITFTQVDFDKIDPLISQLEPLLKDSISRSGVDWKAVGFHMAACNITSLYQYGKADSILREVWKMDARMHGRQQVEEDTTSPLENSAEANTASEPAAGALPSSFGNDQRKLATGTDLENAIDGSSNSMPFISFNASKRLAYTVLTLVLERHHDPNVMPHLLAWMVFLNHIVRYERAKHLIEMDFPFQSLIQALNKLYVDSHEPPALYGADIDDKLRYVQGERPLPEEFDLLGFEWAQNYMETEWFTEKPIDTEERCQESEGMEKTRQQRILWLAVKLSAVKQNDWIAFDPSSKSFSIHPSLKSRTDILYKQTSKDSKERKETSPEKTVQDRDCYEESQSDVEMNADGYVMVEHEPLSEGVKKLKHREQELKAQIAAQALRTTVKTEAIAEASKPAPTTRGPEIMNPKYTVFILDTNLLISHLDTFSLLVARGWPVIIPNAVITELHGLSTKTGSVGDSCRSAMISIKRAIADHKDVKILTAQNSDLSRTGFYKEQVQEQENVTNMDDVIILVASNQLKLRREAWAVKGVTDFEGAELAILLTEDTNMRVKAKAQQIEAMSTTSLKRHLVQLGENVKASSPSSPRQKRKQTPQLSVRIQGEYDDEDPVYVPTQEDFNTKAKTPHHRRNKRGKTIVE